MSIKCIKSLYAFIKHQRYLATHLIWYFEWYYDQFSGPCLGNLRPKMMVLYGKIGLNIKTVGHCSLNSNFPSINFPRYMHCGQYKERWNVTHLWAFSRGSGYLIIDLNIIEYLNIIDLINKICWNWWLNLNSPSLSYYR